MVLHDLTYTLLADILRNLFEPGIARLGICDVRAHVIFEHLPLLLDISTKKFLQKQRRVRELAVIQVGRATAGHAQEHSVHANPEAMVAVNALPHMERFVGQHRPALLAHRLGGVRILEAVIAELDACRHWLPAEPAEGVPSSGDPQTLER